MSLFILKVLSNGALALASMAIGAVLTAVVLQMRGRRASVGQQDVSVTENAARTQLAIEQIRQLAVDIANDVGDHGSVMAGWSEQLDATQKDGGEAAEIQSLVEGMIAANHKLHSRLKEAEQKIALQAEEIRTQESNAKTDALTGLANRRAFDLELNQCMVGAAGGDPCSLIVFDIDHFKSFNDAHGHLAGDEVLRTVARTVAEIVRRPFVAARYGGEEFAAILPKTTSQQAQGLASRLRLAIQETSIAFEGKALSVTASIGFSQAAPGEHARDLVRRADEAVYAAKAAGRNCCFWHDGVRVLPAQGPSATSPAASRSRAKGAIENLIQTQAASLAGSESLLKSLNTNGSLLGDHNDECALLYVVPTKLPVLRGRDEQQSSQLLSDLLATVVTSTCRHIDRIAYAGDGEFIVVLPGLCESAARIVSQRIRTAIESHLIPTETGAAHMKAGIGVVAIDGSFDLSESIALAKQLAIPSEFSGAKNNLIEPSLVK